MIDIMKGVEHVQSSGTLQGAIVIPSPLPTRASPRCTPSLHPVVAHRRCTPSLHTHSLHTFSLHPLSLHPLPVQHPFGAWLANEQWKQGWDLGETVDKIKNFRASNGEEIHGFAWQSARLLALNPGVCGRGSLASRLLVCRLVACLWLHACGCMLVAACLPLIACPIASPITCLSVRLIACLIAYVSDWIDD